MNRWFQGLARNASAIVGSAAAFLLACVMIAIWAVCGPLMGFSNTWQLIINTGTGIVTFLVVFLIQYAQNRDTQAIRLKLDELLRATEGARASLIDLDRLSDEELERLQQEFKTWRQKRDHRLETP
jgi:low affinity Fe/Cu permease